MKKQYPRIISGGYIKALGLSIGFGRIPNKNGDCRGICPTGVNYWDTEIDKYTLEQIKKLYPDTWEDI